jgi:hypothetical protein
MHDYDTFFQTKPKFMKGEDLRILVVVGKAHLVGMKELWDKHYQDRVSLAVNTND